MKQLLDKIAGRQASVAVIGLGYVGLPLCAYAAEAGYSVAGFDVDEARVDKLKSCESYLVDISSEQLAAIRREKDFQVSAEADILAGADVMIICVPTPLTPNQVPDMTYLREAAEAVSQRLQPGGLVIVESTTYPGCTRDEIRPIIERNGLRAGDDFLLAFSPERVNPGNGAGQMTATPKLVGGITSACLKAAAEFYRSFFDEVIELSSAEVAEMAKLLENVYRSVNIALVNELATICNSMGISVWEVIEAAATKPFGFTPFYPGPGLGGHCIPIDPFYLSWKARELGLATEFIELAGKVNTHMPVYVVERLTSILNDNSRSVRGSSILMIGAAYKGDVADMRESPSLRVAEILIEKGATVSYHDPYVASFEIAGLKLDSSPLDRDALSEADCVVVLTPHNNIDWDLVYQQASLILDTRNMVPHDGKKSFSI